MSYDTQFLKIMLNCKRCIGLAIYFMMINVLGLSPKSFHSFMGEMILDLFIKRTLQGNKYPENIVAG